MLVLLMICSSINCTEMSTFLNGSINNTITDIFLVKYDYIVYSNQISPMAYLCVLFLWSNTLTEED